MVSSLSIRNTYLHKKWGVMPLLNLEICYLCPEPVPMNIISGLVLTDSGNIFFEGRPYRATNPVEAIDAGTSYKKGGYL